MTFLLVLKTINARLLNEQLRAAFPGVQDVWLFMTDNGVAIGIPNGVSQSAVEAILAAHSDQEQSDDDKLRAAIVSVAQSAVGVTINDLTAAQVKALLAVLLAKNGAINPDTLAINPLNQWAV